MGKCLVRRAKATLAIGLAMLMLATVWNAPQAASQTNITKPATETSGSTSDSPGSTGGSVNAIPGFYPVGFWPTSEAAGLDIDPDTGLLWYSNSDSEIVTILDHAGNVVDSFGGPGSSPGQFAGAGGIAVADDEVFVTDHTNNRVQVFDKAGNYLRSVGLGVLNGPCGIEIVNTRTYVASSGTDEVTIFAANGGVLDTFDGSDSGTTLALGCLVDMVTAYGSELFVADWFNGRVAVFDLDGAWLRNIAVGGSPSAADADDDGNIWVADFSGDRISVWTAAGAFIGDIDLSGSALGQLEEPQSIVVDPSGSTFWVAERMNDRIQRFTELMCDGQLVTHVGTSYDDRFTTTTNADIVHSAGGNDRIRGTAGDDTICGGAGNDNLDGGGGADTILGGPGDDTIAGRGGIDTLNGHSGDDTIDGQGAADTIIGGDGADDINGQNGADDVLAGAGDDVVKTQTGPDTIQGQGGDDMISAGNGNDTLYGGPGFDRCSGNTGNGDQAEAATCEQTPGIEILF